MTCHYTFDEIFECNMCGEATSSARVLGLSLNRSQGARPRRKTGIAVAVCRCSACGLVFPNPQPRPRSISDHYDVSPEEYWNELQIRDTSGFEEYYKIIIARAKALLHFRPGMTFLDIGAGLGAAMSTYRAAGFDVYGIEPSGPFRQRALQITQLSEARIQLASLKMALSKMTFSIL